MTYEDFLNGKKNAHALSGFHCDTFNNSLFPFQRWIVERALMAGKYAIFANTGLGKSLMQLEWANRVNEREGKPVLILAPLAVVGQTINEGNKFGISVSDTDPSVGIFITNYEDLDNVDVSMFCGVVLDESSILKDFQSKTKQKIIDSFRYTPYKLACTATPSPNDTTEICNHAEFLNVMSREEMLAMYFIHDGGDTSKWRLKRHAEDVFWRFVSSWATMVSTPSDIGFSDDGYILPRLNIEEVFVETPIRTETSLFNDVLVSATDFHRELRDTQSFRLDKTIELVRQSDDTTLIWINHDSDGDYLRKHLPDAVEVRGSDPKDQKRDKLIGFGRGDFKILITKPKIARFGMNYQNCHRQIFTSMTYSFEDAYQCIRRSYRFGQKKEVDIYLIVTDTMQGVRSSINKKQTMFEKMQKQMAEAANSRIFQKNDKKHTFHNQRLPSWI